MRSADLQAFTDLLAGVFDAYGRQAPMPETQAIWWRLLEGFDLSAVTAAFTRYVATEPKFPPTPAQIRETLGAGRGDGRPGADEAWAIALASRDEADTVVWTPEIAEAFGVCRTVLGMGDEVGARMAFKGAYERIVNAARLRNEPAQWVASIGFDPDRREKALRQAETAGLLAAPQVAALLPPPEPAMTPEQTEQARANLAKLKAMLAGIGEARGQDRAARVEASKAALAARKAEIDAQVRQHAALGVAA